MSGGTPLFNFAARPRFPSHRHQLSPIALKRFAFGSHISKRRMSAITGSGSVQASVAETALRSRLFGQQWERIMRITPFLRGQIFDPDLIEAMSMAFTE